MHLNSAAALNAESLGYRGSKCIPKALEAITTRRQIKRALSGALTIECSEGIEGSHKTALQLRGSEGRIGNEYTPETSNQMNRTKFVCSFMDRLKRERKRQQKIKSHAKSERILLQEADQEGRLNLTQYELPEVKKKLHRLQMREARQTCLSNRTKNNQNLSKIVLPLSKRESTLKINPENMEQNLPASESKSPNKIPQKCCEPKASNVEEFEVKYKVKVQEIVSDIIKNRNKPSRSHDLFGDEQLGTSSFLLNQFKPSKPNTPKNELPKLRTASLFHFQSPYLKKQQKNQQRHTKKIQPWESAQEKEDPCSTGNGIEAFFFS